MLEGDVVDEMRTDGIANIHHNNIDLDFNILISSSSIKYLSLSEATRLSIQYVRIARWYSLAAFVWC